MNKYMNYCIPFIFLFTACSDFLEYKDKDKVIPGELNHYEELILGELLLSSSEGVGYNLEAMTDDIEDFTQASSYSITDDRKPYKGYYLWAKDPQIGDDGTEYQDNAWEFFYNKILVCNIIESEVGELAEDLEGRKYRLLGEAQMMRAINYFYLVNIYGQPYQSAEQANTALGVPENLETGIYDKIYTRKTLQENYNLIEKDLKAAIANFAKGDQKKTMFRPGADAAKLFLSRVYLFQNKYQDVIDLCSELLGETDAFVQTLDKMKVFDQNNEAFFSKSNPCILFTWSARGGNPFDYYNQGRYRTSTNLKNLFVPEDTRPKAWFESSSWSNNKDMKFSYKSDTYGRVLRIEEAYINRAEAYLKTGQIKLGLADVNYIRLNRINAVNYKVETEDAKVAWEAYQVERRREFCFEEFRWFDIRRWGVEITHKYHDILNINSYIEYVLKKDSPNYVLPLPLDIQRRNDKIEKFERNESEILK